MNFDIQEKVIAAVNGLEGHSMLTCPIHVKLLHIKKETHKCLILSYHVRKGGSYNVPPSRHF